jgi:hypothetical protein
VKARAGPSTALRAGTSPFVVLWREFVGQFFASEWVTSDIQLRQTIIWGVAFLITPGFFLVVKVLPAFKWSLAVNPAVATQILTLLGSIFVTYSMVTIGFIAVFVWDALTFDTRDAMVLGPLPVGGTTIIAAKLAALGTFLLGTALAVNLFTAVPFALATAEGIGSFVRAFGGHLAATIGAAVFAFTAIVMIRGLVALFAGARLAAMLGSLMQFVFVAALLCFVVLSQEEDPAIFNAGAAPHLPPAWFLGLFTQGIGLPMPGTNALAGRALLAMAITVAGAVGLTFMTFRRQMQLALAPAASAGPIGGAKVSRMIARWLGGRDQVATATSEFILLTIARNRQQQGPIVISAAVGVAIVAAALSRHTDGLQSLMGPRTAVLWIPLVLAYWTVIGLRASFFVPSELPGSWSLRANGPEQARAYWAAVRASIVAFVLPTTLLLVACLIPLVGWEIAAWHAVLATAMVVLLAEVVALTIDYVPFTQPYQPGHAKLKSRWPLYVLGMYATAYWPVRAELRSLDDPGSLLTLLAVVAIAIVAIELVGRRRAREWSVLTLEETMGDESPLTVLDLGSARHHA